MKKFLFITLAALCSITMSCLAGTYAVASSDEETATIEAYEETLCEAVAGLREAQSLEEVEAAATVLETVTKQEPENWLAHYHLAYAYGRIAHTIEKKKDIDGWVEKATEAVEQASNCSNVDVSEIETLQAFLVYGSMRANPMIRGYKLNSTALGHLKAAVKANGKNPRAYLLTTRHVMNTPAVFGGGDIEKICKYSGAAQRAFELEKANEERDPLSPSWGQAESDEIAATIDCADESGSKRD